MLLITMDSSTNKIMTSDEIRKSFLHFFEQKGHHIVPSCSLLPEAPNLLFTNAGMNPFVPYFLGERKPKYLRVADTQKCIRAGGKHNDLEEVGFDTYHHTFFEMLGNWSFGDYFKREAIQWAWELLTKVWHFPKERLYATVYQPNEGDPATFDHEAYTFWKEIFIHEGLDPETHIVYGNKKDNFWMMGNTGPCGPCSEIHIDLTPNGDTQGRLVNKGDVRCIEIWNLVFMQYNCIADGKWERLQNQFVDTGLGLERVAGIFATTKNFTDFSHIPSNYDSDLFAPIFDSLQKQSGHTYGGKVAANTAYAEDTLFDCAFRIIADHIRTLSFAITDGILPGNEGRNYVLRRIARRAILFGRKLKLPSGFFSDLSTIVVQKMGNRFPELIQHAETIKRVIRKEEMAFDDTLSRGLHLFERWLHEGITSLSGDKAFLLYDTYGFPLDLTQLLAKEHAIEVDTEGFEVAMQEQKSRSRASQKKASIVLNHEGAETQFVGYDEGNLTAWETKLVSIEKQGDKAFIITESSPFYGEKGGQVGDIGWISLADGQKISVINTLWQQKTLLHQIQWSDLHKIENFVDHTILLSVDTERRKSISRNHTATHLLHWALREVIGSHVHQAGSWVSNNNFRFDFSHFEKLTNEQIQTIEQLCNQQILSNSTVFTEEIDFDKKPENCLAFFNDKYGNRVRVVHIGDFSLELCGGTHVHATGELGQIKILQETAVASGVRRIEAITGFCAYQHNTALESRLQQLETLFECPCDKIFEKYQRLLEQKQQLKTVYRQTLQKDASHLVQKQQNLDGLKCVQFCLQTIDMATLRGLCKSYFIQNHIDILWAAGENNGKGFVLVFCSANATEKHMSANHLIQHFLTPLGANGGGKPDFATGGVKEITVLKTHWAHLSFES
jgi:alanyl-tRNA synthetase